MKKIAPLIIAIIMCFTLLGCSDEGGFMKEKDILQLEKNPTGTITFSFLNNLDETITGFFNFELFYDKAPITVTNFVKLVESGFYDDTFCMSGNTTEGSAFINIDCYDVNIDESMEQKETDYYIKGEFSANGWEINDTEHTFGTMTMLMESGNDTASAYFQIILNDNSSDLDGSSAAFGRIISETMDSAFFSNYLNLYKQVSVSEFKVTSITVNTHGAELGSPKTIKK